MLYPTELRGLGGQARPARNVHMPISELARCICAYFVVRGNPKVGLLPAVSMKVALPKRSSGRLLAHGVAAGLPQRRLNIRGVGRTLLRDADNE